MARVIEERPQVEQAPFLLSVDSKVNGQPVPKLPLIPRARYVDEAFYQAEIDHIFRKSWLLLAHISEFPQIGSYKLFDLPDLGPVVIVRGKDKKLRAFLNSCRHRGATVLRDSEGCRNVMICQYHGWTYNLQGDLIGVTNPEAFPDFDKTQYSLPGLRCEQWGGFVYINFDEAAKPLLEWLGPVVEVNDHVMNAPDKPLTMLSRNSFEVACNWKLMYENFIEGYHVNFVHGPSISKMMDQTKGYSELFANGCFSSYSFYRPRKEMNYDGNTPESVAPTLPGMEGKDFDSKFITVGMFPNVTIPAVKQSYTTFQVLPIGIDRCQFTYCTYVTDWGDAAKPSAWDNADAGTNAFVQEDMATMACVQKSIEAAPDQHIPVGGYEIPLFHFNTAIDRMIGAENIPDGCALPNADALQAWVTR